MTEEEINEENNQSQAGSNTGFMMPAEDVGTSTTTDVLSDAAGTVLGEIVGGVIEGIGSVISSITD